MQCAVEWDSEREWKCRPLKAIEPETKMLSKLFIETSQDNDGVGVEKLPGPH